MKLKIIKTILIIFNKLISVRINKNEYFKSRFNSFNYK